MTLLTGLATAAPVDMAKRAGELKSLRWGMFVCWSFSTYSGKEWTPGVKDIAFFKATDVDTDQWARTAKEAGMGYILFLTKHHDGFCLWDTKTTDRKVTKAPLGRDVLAELKKSCDKHGIKLALYFSEGEWLQPGGLDDPATPGPKKPNQGGANAELKKAQLKELLTQYGPVEFIWFDHAVGTGGLSHKETIAWCKSLQPGCFVGFNTGDQEGTDIRLGERGKPGPLTDHSGAGYNKGAPSKLGYPYHVPYRSILPKPEQCTNLLVPVALSCTHVGISSLRIEGAWMAIGQGAGVAAALAARENVAVQDLPYPTLRERLRAQGQVLDLP